MVDVDGSCQFSADSQPKSIWLDLRVGSHPALNLHSSNEPGELLQNCGCSVNLLCEHDVVERNCISSLESHGKALETECCLPVSFYYYRFSHFSNAYSCDSARRERREGLETDGGEHAA